MSAANQSPQPSLPYLQYRLIHDIYVFLDAGDTIALGDYQVTPSQFTLLMLLDTGEGQNLIRLAERMLVARSTITRLIDQLESMGLVSRVTDPFDRRALRVALTRAGESLRKQAYTAHERSLSHRFAALCEEDQAQLQELLKKLRDSLLEGITQPPAIDVER